MVLVGTKRWRVAPQIPPSVEKRLSEFDPVLAQVLFNRSVRKHRRDVPIEDAETAKTFLDGDVAEFDSFRMKDMSRAVGRIRQAIKRQERIVVYGDFDADGVTSTALLVQALEGLGAREVEPFIPHRVEDGYGLSSATLVSMAQDGVKLVITVDCGIRAVQEVEDAQKYGLDVIITDHHSIGPELPPAYAIINPKRDDCEYPEDMLAGVGVAFHLANALIRAARQQGEQVAVDVDDLLPLVAVGTVADLAPLNSIENRAFVRRGLPLIARHAGLYELTTLAGGDPSRLQASSIGYMLGPRLNAAGRMQDASIAYDLLRADQSAAAKLAVELEELNRLRQDETQAAQLKARELAFQGVSEDVPLIFVADRSFESGIVGLVAGRLAEEFYRPVVIVEMGDDEECRGSCRSIPEFNIVQALDECADLLVRHGGHAQAAGFTVRRENLELLRDRLFEKAQNSLLGDELRPTLEIDAEVPVERLTLGLAEELRKLEPFGHGNPQPVLMTSGLQVRDARQVGKEGAHLKLTFGGMGYRLDAIAFRMGQLLDDLPRRVDVAYHLEVNEWRGQRRLQLNVKDIRPTV
ncbi:MAG: single-stranded-DNA-specific exonuclease RecJ [Anaerolineae bacterium]